MSRLLKNAAAICRQRNLNVGDVLSCDSVDRYTGEERHWGDYVITAIGERAILVRSINNKVSNRCVEVRWINQLSSYYAITAINGVSCLPEPAGVE